MAQDLGQDIDTAPTDSVIMPTSDVTDGNNTGLFGTTAVAGIDLGAAPQPLRIAYNWQQTTLTSAVGPAFLYVHWSLEDTDYSDIDNGELIGVMDCAASTDVELIGDFPVKGRYFKLSIVNESGGTLDFTSSNSAIALKENFGDQA